MALPLLFRLKIVFIFRALSVRLRRPKKLRGEPGTHHPSKSDGMALYWFPAIDETLSYDFRIYVACSALFSATDNLFNLNLFCC